VCTGRLPEPGARPSAERVEHVRRFVRGADVVIEPRKRWPAGVGRRGSIVGASEGRAVAFGDDPGWAAELGQWAGSRHDGQVPPALLDGVVETLRRWAQVWRERPVAVVPLPGPDHRASRTVAQHVADVGRLPLVDALEWTGGAAPDDAASAAVVGHLESVLTLSDPDAVPSGPVLLVGATMRSGWEHTVAAVLLRDGGCSEVLPLVVHRRP
jgi:ATP-dependent DNA helicase RecQ